ncbi:uncharacterized protein EDB91DRAFT_1335834 [Suillus paluster]|uniref:uncharacterized protein n=1 Tax=Suillus paluster TaxID=48578 RepID=UPI001B871798|nr:uncharacterized protein EDB91DRAFT_1335834 [Suillus paluster]KAG1743170.1 hypothetical protein EDB91DRAFT_1335834 [Suillus paluster]
MDIPMTFGNQRSGSAEQDVISFADSQGPNTNGEIGLQKSRLLDTMNDRGDHAPALVGVEVKFFREHISPDRLSTSSSQTCHNVRSLAIHGDEAKVEMVGRARVQLTLRRLPVSAGSGVRKPHNARVKYTERSGTYAVTASAAELQNYSLDERGIVSDSPDRTGKWKGQAAVATGHLAEPGRDSTTMDKTKLQNIAPSKYIIRRH